MSKRNSDDYERLLSEAGDAAEQDADDQLVSETIEARLAALVEEGQEPSEAEQAAAAAEPPRERSDGVLIGTSDIRARPLTKQQLAFAEGVIQGKSRIEAYRDAYPNSTAARATVSASASRLMRDPRIKRMVAAAWDETQEHLADDVQATRRYVGRALVALSRGAKQETTRVRALELLGRSAGMFKDQQAQEAKPLSADDLRKELAGHLKLVAGAAKAK